VPVGTIQRSLLLRHGVASLMVKARLRRWLAFVLLLLTSAMAELVEIRIDGRGGQGNVVAAYMLAEAGFEAGRHVQAFPSFGPERRGAPVAAFVRVSDQPFKRRCQVHAPHYVIVQDPTLLHAGAPQDVRPEGGILINSQRSLEDLAVKSHAHIAVVPASTLALRVLGRSIPNSALLAAFLALTELMPMEALEKALSRRFADDTLQRNLQLTREAAGYVTAGAWKERSCAARH